LLLIPSENKTRNPTLELQPPGWNEKKSCRINCCRSNEPSPEVGFRVFMKIISTSIGELVRPGKNVKPASKKY
jgi:hypothetical protein